MRESLQIAITSVSVRKWPHGTKISFSDDRITRKKNTYGPNEGYFTLGNRRFIIRNF